MSSKCTKCGAVSNESGVVTGGSRPCDKRDPLEDHNFPPATTTSDYENRRIKLLKKRFTLQPFNDRKAPVVTIDLDDPSNFMGKLRTAVGDDVFAEYDRSIVQFCCYLELEPNNSRTYFTSANFLENTAILGNMLYFFGGDTPPSPEKVLQSLQEKQIEFSRSIEVIADFFQTSV